MQFFTIETNPQFYFSTPNSHKAPVIPPYTSRQWLYSTLWHAINC